MKTAFRHFAKVFFQKGLIFRDFNPKILNVLQFNKIF